jgi:hypothetical protein
MANLERAKGAAMIDLDIEDALAAFEASRSAKSPIGSQVAAKLRSYGKDDEIAFDPLGPKQYGESVAHRMGPNVRVNSVYKGDAGSTSLVLAHEGVHRVLNTHSIEEEIVCFDFQCTYFRELVPGVSYFSPTKGMRTTAQTSAAIPGAPSETANACKWQTNNQLVDYVIAIPVYQDRVDVRWVKSNLPKWGGLANRWATSRGLFVRALAAHANPANGTLILDILESISQQQHWNELLRVAGDFNQVRKTLHTVRDAPVAGHRMKALAAKWNFDWKVR